MAWQVVSARPSAGKVINQLLQLLKAAVQLILRKLNITGFTDKFLTIRQDPLQEILHNP